MKKTRREFVRQATKLSMAGGAFAVGIPSHASAALALAKPKNAAASDAIGVGIIGTGGERQEPSGEYQWD